MELLIIEGDSTTPKVNLNPDSGMFFIGGLAVPEDVREISNPILTWLKDYLKTLKPATELTLFFEYLNTAATKFIFQVCELLNNSHSMETRIKLTWKYYRGDIEMLELGEEIFDEFTCLTEIVAVDGQPS